MDGAEYEIDLDAEHAHALRHALARYVSTAAGRGRCRAASPARAQGVSGGPDSTEVRERATAQGIGVRDRGQVPAELVVTFKAAAGQ